MKAICNDGKHFITLELSVSDYQRVKACLNAMDGIDDPAAARVILDSPRTAAATDMLELLKRIEAWFNHGSIDSIKFGADLKIVLSKAEGRAK